MGRDMIKDSIHSRLINTTQAAVINVIAIAGLVGFSAQSVAQVQFQDITNSVGTLHTGESWGASWCDINGDKYPDLYVSNHGMNTSIYRNNGGNTFTDVTAQVDLDQVLFKPGDRNTNEADMHGASCADWDNDGDQDLFATRSSAGTTVFLLENDGTGKFRERRQSYGLTGSIGGGRLPVHMDYDNDGKTDVAIAKNDSTKLQLFKQVANKRFTNTNNATGINLQCNRNFFGFPSRLFDDDKHLYFCMEPAGVPEKVFDTSVTPFVDVTGQVDSAGGIYSDATMADFNNDLKTDMIVIRGKNRPNGIKRISPSRIEAWVTADGQERLIKFKSSGSITINLHSRTVATKVNGKYPKIFLGSNGTNPTTGGKFPNLVLSPTNTAHQGVLSNRNPNGAYIGYDTAAQEWNIYLTSDLVYFVINGSGFNIPSLSGLRTSDGPVNPTFLINNGNRMQNSGSRGISGIVCNSVIAEDFDNDMDVDVYVGCSSSVENLANRFYWNNGNGTFSGGGGHGAAGSVGVGIANSSGTTETVSAADWNVDGFIDILATQGSRIFPHNRKDGFTGGGPDQMFKNAGNANKWLEIDLKGVNSTRDGFGTKVIVTAGGVSQLREQDGRYHRWSHDHRRLHFGLKNNNQATVRVEWPDGTVDIYNNVQANKLYQAEQDGALTDITPGSQPGGPQVSINSIAVGEDAGTAQLTLSLSQSSTTTVSVNYATADGSAIAGTDYTARSATITFQPGQTSKQATITITDDNEQESSEDFTVNLSNPTGGATISQGVGTVTINDDDTGGGGESISINDLTISEAAGSVGLTLSLSQASTSAISVDYATANGSATAGSDYTSRSATINFAPGETSKTATITIIDDNAQESSEDFTVNLSNPTGGATISDSAGTVTINDDDSPNTLSACGNPQPDRTTEKALFIWKDCAGNGTWHMYATAGGSSSSVGYNGGVTTDQTFSNVSSNNFESTDSLTSTNQAIVFTMETLNIWYDEILFNVGTGGETCMTLDTPANAQIIVGAQRNSVGASFNLHTLGICEGGGGGNGPNLSINSFTVSESANSAVMAISMSPASASTVKVMYATANGSATAGSDYTTRTGTVTFQPGQTNKTATIALLGDSVEEATEEFTVNLSNPTGGANISQAVGTVTITDDDTGGGGDACGNPNYDRMTDRGLFVWKDCAGTGRWFVHGTAGGGSNVRYIGNLSTNRNFSAVTNISIESSDTVTNTANSINFNMNTGSVWFDGFRFNVVTGSTCLTLDMPAAGPIFVGGSRTPVTSPFNIETLASCGGGGNNPTISIGNRTVSESNGAAIMMVSLSAASTSTIKVKYASANGSAIAGSDYTARNGQITFMPGQTQKTATINLINNNAAEPTETFTVNLSNATGGATISQAVGTVTVNDDD